jgi:hypothetical protein
VNVEINYIENMFRVLKKTLKEQKLAIRAFTSKNEVNLNE